MFKFMFIFLRLQQRLLVKFFLGLVWLEKVEKKLNREIQRKFCLKYGLSVVGEKKDFNLISIIVVNFIGQEEIKVIY